MNHVMIYIRVRIWQNVKSSFLCSYFYVNRDTMTKVWSSYSVYYLDSIIIVELHLQIEDQGGSFHDGREERQYSISCCPLL